MNTKNLVKRLNRFTGDFESLGKTLKAFRLCEELTQKEFSQLLGVTVSYLGDLENGRKIASPRKAYEYAEKLGYSTKEFVRLALQDEANKLMNDKGLHAKVQIDFDKICLTL